jgi:hypothetical protein
LGNSHGDGTSGARAALGLLASRLLALQLALGLGAVGGLGALVEASEFLANRLALGLGGLRRWCGSEQACRLTRTWGSLPSRIGPWGNE